MELVMWIMVGILAGAASIVLIPVLVLGTWYVVMTVTLGLVDGIVWLLDQRWKPRMRSPFATGMPPKAIDVEHRKVLSTG
jgi:hypothetical protein